MLESTFVTKDQAAAIVGISRKKFDRVAKKVGLVSFKFSNRHNVGVRFVRADVIKAKEALLANTGYPARIAAVPLMAGLRRKRQPKLPGE